jgi:osmotically inducible lipoprotein OsmB
MPHNVTIPGKQARSNQKGELMTTKFLLSMAAASLFALTGCGTSPTHGQIGTATGAVLGGVVGNAVFDSTLGTVGGAAAGAVIGNEVGKKR